MKRMGLAETMKHNERLNNVYSMARRLKDAEEFQRWRFETLADRRAAHRAWCMEDGGPDPGPGPHDGEDPVHYPTDEEVRARSVASQPAAPTRLELRELRIIWLAMKTRYHNPEDPSYRNYGGRGITVCDEWRESFEAFAASMGRRPSEEYSVDRIDNDKGYEPGNCRWATRHEQANNRRTTIRLTFRGVTKSISEWAAMTGLTKYRIRTRMKEGLSPEDCLADGCMALLDLELGASK